LKGFLQFLSAFERFLCLLSGKIGGVRVRLGNLYGVERGADGFGTGLVRVRCASFFMGLTVLGGVAGIETRECRRGCKELKEN